MRYENGNKKFFGNFKKGKFEGHGKILVNKIYHCFVYWKENYILKMEFSKYMMEISKMENLMEKVLLIKNIWYFNNLNYLKVVYFMKME